MSSNFQSIRPGKRVRDPTVTDIRQLKYLPNGKVLYTLDYSDNWLELPCKRAPTPLQQYNIALFKRSPPISDDKFHHLQDLKEVIEKDHHPFYDALSHTNKKDKKLNVN